MPLNLSNVNILYDVNMADSSAPGVITLGTNANVVVDPAAGSTRLVCAALIVGSGGNFQAGTASAAYAGTAFKLDICGDMPTVSGNAGGGALVRGAQYVGDTPTGNNGTTNDNFGMSRGVIVQAGGNLSIAGNSAPIITRAFTSIAVGQAYVDVDATVPSSMVGGSIMVTPDGFFNTSKRTETFTVASVTAITGGTRVGISGGTFGFTRFGQKQYATDTGLSLTPGSFTLRSSGNPTGMQAISSQPSLIDYCRAVVVIHKNNISINGYDLSGHSNLANGDGVHTMQMGLTSRVVMKNLTINNFGQRGLTGRYGIHVHIPSYNANGTAKNDGSTVGNLNSAFGGGTYKCNYGPGESLYQGIVGINGFNRFGVQHACRGVVFDSCIAKDAKGHAFFQETGSEEENTINGCLSIGHTDPAPGYAIQLHETGTLSSGFWFANHFNVHTNNFTVDTTGSPFHNAMSFGIDSKRGTGGLTVQNGCFAFAINVPISPGFSRNGTWSNNGGLCFNAPARSLPGQNFEDGTSTGGGKIQATTDGIASTNFGGPAPTATGMIMTGAKLHKGQAYNNSISWPLYDFWQSTDQGQTHWFGTTHAGPPSYLKGATIIYESLNHESHYLRSGNGGKGIFSAGVVSYHGTLAVQYCSWYNFSGSVFTTDGANHGAVQGIGAIESWDHYLDGAVDYHVNNPGWCLYNSNGVWQTPPSGLTQNVSTYDYITGTASPGPKYPHYSASDPALHAWNESVILDRWGSLSTGPTTAGRPDSFVVFNQPYFTYGLADTPIALEGNPESVTTTTPWMGFQVYDSVSDTFPTARRYARTLCQRVDTSGNDVSGAILDLPAFDINSTILINHAVQVPVYHNARISWPGFAKPTAPIYLQVGWPCSYIYQPDGRWAYRNPNQNESTAYVIVGVDWGTSITSISGNFLAPPSASSLRFLSSTSVANFAALQGKTDNLLWHWNDTTNQIVWVRMPIMTTLYRLTIS